MDMLELLERIRVSMGKEVVRGQYRKQGPKFIHYPYESLNEYKYNLNVLTHFLNLLSIQDFFSLKKNKSPSSYFTDDTLTYYKTIIVTTKNGIILLTLSTATWTRVYI